jgi:WD40 repeat protein
LAAGESAFKKAEINIWRITYETRETLNDSLRDNKESAKSLSPTKTTTISIYTFVCALKGHKYGVEAIRFSPDARYLVSLGDTSDKGLFLWDW